MSFHLFATRFPVLDLECQGYFPPNSSGVFISQESKQLVRGWWQPSLHICVCVLFERCVCHALVFPMPLLCQSLCVICRQLEVCGNRDLLFSHMLLYTHPLFFLALSTPLFVCLHVKSVALVSLTHSPSSYYVSQHSSSFLSSPNPRRCALGSDRVKWQASCKSHTSQHSKCVFF